MLMTIVLVNWIGVEELYSTSGCPAGHDNPSNYDSSTGDGSQAEIPSKVFDYRSTTNSDLDISNGDKSDNNQLRVRNCK